MEIFITAETDTLPGVDFSVLSVVALSTSWVLLVEVDVSESGRSVVDISTVGEREAVRLAESVGTVESLVDKGSRRVEVDWPVGSSLASSVVDSSMYNVVFDKVSATLGLTLDDADSLVGLSICSVNDFETVVAVVVAGPVVAVES